MTIAETRQVMAAAEQGPEQTRDRGELDQGSNTGVKKDPQSKHSRNRPKTVVGTGGNALDRPQARTGCDVPWPEHGGPRLEHGGPRPEHGGPRPEHSGPRPEHRGPRPEHSGPQIDHGGPQTGTWTLVRRVPAVVHRVPSVVRRVPTVVRHIPAVVHRVPAVVRRVPAVVRRVPAVVHCVPAVVRRERKKFAPLISAERVRGAKRSFTEKRSTNIGCVDGALG